MKAVKNTKVQKHKLDEQALFYVEQCLYQRKLKKLLIDIYPEIDWESFFDIDWLIIMDKSRKNKELIDIYDGDELVLEEAIIFDVNIAIEIGEKMEDFQ